MPKEEIIEALRNPNTIDGHNSMGVTESYYNKFYLTREFLENKKLNAEELTEKELNLILDCAEFSGEVFY